MSIQRYDYSGVLMNTDVNEWVKYEDYAKDIATLSAIIRDKEAIIRDLLLLVGIKGRP